MWPAFGATSARIGSCEVGLQLHLQDRHTLPRHLTSGVNPLLDSWYGMRGEPFHKMFQLGLFLMFR